GSIHELSYREWVKASSKATKPPVSQEEEYILASAYWKDHDVPDRTPRFVEEGIWINGYGDQYLEEVKAVEVGTRIAIKATRTTKHDLPFDAKGHTVSRMTIKALGTVTANRGDGRHLEVEWETDYEPRDWYFYTIIKNFWKLRTDTNYKHLRYARQLIDFIWGEADQDYAW